MKSLNLPEGTTVIVLASGLALTLAADTEVTPDREISADGIAEHFVASGRPDLLQLVAHTEEKTVIDEETKTPKVVQMQVAYAPNGQRVETILETEEEPDVRTPEEKFRDEISLKTVAVLKKATEFLQIELPREANRKDEIVAILIEKKTPEEITAQITAAEELLKK